MKRVTYKSAVVSLIFEILELILCIVLFVFNVESRFVLGLFIAGVLFLSIPSSIRLLKKTSKLECEGNNDETKDRLTIKKTGDGSVS